MFTRLRREPDATPEGLLEEHRAFLDPPPVNQGADDDKTLVLVTRLTDAAVRKVDAFEPDRAASSLGVIAGDRVAITPPGPRLGSVP